MFLGERLYSLRLVSRSDVRAALHQQHLHGGRIGTQLVQLRSLTLDQLSTALGAHLAVPAIVSGEFEAITPDVVERVPRALAEKHTAVPVSLKASGTLVVAMLDPRSLGAIDDLERAAGARIVACVAPELRLRYWLERLYGVARSPELLRAAEAGAPAAGERRKRIPSVPPLSPRDQAQLLPSLAGGGEEVEITVSSAQRSEDGQAAADRLSQAASGEQVADAVASYLALTPHGGLLFRVRPDVALFWRAAGQLDVPSAKLVAVPLSLPTAFRTACQTRKTFRGQPPEAGREWHQRLSALFGVGAPHEIVVVPVVTAGRPIALLYVESGPDGPLADVQIADLEGLAEAISAGLQRRFSAASR
jgi:hypothetical protein